MQRLQSVIRNHSALQRGASTFGLRRSTINSKPVRDYAKIKTPLDVLFNPKSVAVIGATEKEGSVGRTVLWNLLSSPFGGTVYPVNPKRSNVLGVRALPSVAAITEQFEPVDLAVIMTPAHTVPSVIKECVASGVKGAVVISAGFSEAGPQGQLWGRQMVEEARKGGMRIIGPNCLGVMNPLTGFNATFAKGNAKPGKVAFISQSGALGTAILDWSIKEQVGFSSFSSIGGALDVHFADLIDYHNADPNTESIVMYIESIGDARKFISAARNASLTKPIIVIKVGRTEAGGKAASSHTGSLTGSDAVVDAAFQRCGVTRVESIEQLFSLAEVLSKQPMPRGNKLSIVTNAGGPGALATDALYSGGGELTPLSADALATFDSFLPSAWSHGNPIDILGDAPPERYARALQVAAQDTNSDGMLVILSPQDMTDPTATATALSAYSRLERKPVLACWMGGADVEAGREILAAAKIPTFAYPDTATTVFNYMWKSWRNLRTLYDAPTHLETSDMSQESRKRACDIIGHVRENGRVLLTEAESKELMALYGIPTTRTVVAHTADEAAAAAADMGFPVVVKLHSETITHKMDVGGVKLNLTTADEVRAAFADIQRGVAAKSGSSSDDFLGVTVQPMIKPQRGSYEVIIGSNVDSQFGPVMLFGAGGTFVEVFQDTSLALPPLTDSLARQMIKRTKIAAALRGTRGNAPVDMRQLENILVRFSYLVLEQPLIKEIEINPLVVSPEGAIALDARVVVYDRNVDAADIPKPAFRPFPVEYVKKYTAADGTDYVVQPIRQDDQRAAMQWLERLFSNKRLVESARDERALRYVRSHMMQRLQQSDAAAASASVSAAAAEERLYESLITMCFGDYDREIVLIAKANGNMQAIGRLTKNPFRPAEAELGIAVEEAAQDKKLGTAILSHIVDIARAEGVKLLSAPVNAQNAAMLHVVRKLGFTITPSAEDPNDVIASIDLSQ